MATDAIDKLHSTAGSHERIMAIELMGRHTGWIALYAGVSGSADAILIPEIPFRWDSLAYDIRAKYERGLPYALVVVTKGAGPEGEEAAVVSRAEASCLGTCRGAGSPQPMTGFSRCASGPRPWTWWPGRSSGAWSPSIPRRSWPCRSRRRLRM